MIAQAGATYSILHLLILAVVVGSAWYIAANVLELPPKVMLIINVVLVAIVAIVAIRFLWAFI